MSAPSPTSAHSSASFAGLQRFHLQLIVRHTLTAWPLQLISSAHPPLLVKPPSAMYRGSHPAHRHNFQIKSRRTAYLTSVVPGCFIQRTKPLSAEPPFIFRCLPCAPRLPTPHPFPFPFPPPRCSRVRREASRVSGRAGRRITRYHTYSLHRCSNSQLDLRPKNFLRVRSRFAACQPPYVSIIYLPPSLPTPHVPALP
jgi:hypothetical protein